MGAIGSMGAMGAMGAIGAIGAPIEVPVKKENSFEKLLKISHFKWKQSLHDLKKIKNWKKKLLTKTIICRWLNNNWIHFKCLWLLALILFFCCCSLDSIKISKIQKLKKCVTQKMIQFLRSNRSGYILSLVTYFHECCEHIRLHLICESISWLNARANAHSNALVKQSYLGLGSIPVLNDMQWQCSSYVPWYNVRTKLQPLAN